MDSSREVAMVPAFHLPTSEPRVYIFLTGDPQLASPSFTRPTFPSGWPTIRRLFRPANNDTLGPIAIEVSPSVIPWQPGRSGEQMGGVVARANPDTAAAIASGGARGSPGPGRDSWLVTLLHRWTACRCVPRFHC
jgi:hypothetical protein